MKTIRPRVWLADPDVIDLWLRRHRSPLTRSVYLRDIRRLMRWTGRKLGWNYPDQSRLSRTA